MGEVSAQGYLRIPQIIGRREISEAEALENRRRWEGCAAELQKLEEIKESDAARFGRDPKLQARYRELCAIRARPRRARPAIAALIPVSESGWWAGVKSGRYPQAVKLSDGVTAWRSKDVLALMQRGAVPEIRGNAAATA